MIGRLQLVLGGFLALTLMTYGCSKEKPETKPIEAPIAAEAAPSKPPVPAKPETPAVPQKPKELAEVAEPKNAAPEVENKLVPIKEIPLNASIGRLLPDSKGHIYFLNFSDSLVHRMILKEARIDKSTKAVPGAVNLAISPYEDTLYVVASPKGHNSYRDEGTGVVQVIDAESMQTSTTFSIPFDPFEAVVGDDEFLYISGGSGQWTSLAVVDPFAKSIVREHKSLYQSAPIRIEPNCDRVYYGTAGLSPGDIGAVMIREPESRPYDSPYHGDHPLGGSFEISPDGNYLVAQTGTVLRLASTQDRDLIFATDVKPHIASAFGENSPVLFLATSDAYLLMYSYPEFRLLNSVELKVPAYQMHFDSSSKKLFAAVGGEVRPTHAGKRGRPVGPLQQFDVSGLIGHISTDSRQALWGEVQSGTASSGSPKETSPASMTTAPRQFAFERIAGSIGVKDAVHTEFTLIFRNSDSKPWTACKIALRYRSEEEEVFQAARIVPGSSYKTTTHKPIRPRGNPFKSLSVACAEGKWLGIPK